MIVSLRGTVLYAAGGRVALEVCGVGYAMQTIPELSLSLRTGQEVFVHTVQIVREDSLSLFGFSRLDELEVFEILIAVTGVGPKSALGVLAVMSPEQIADALAIEDDAAFRKVSGIGPKTAKLIVVSLAGQLSLRPRVSAVAVGSAAVKASVIEALLGLGWSEHIAVDTVRQLIMKSADPVSETVPGLLRSALSSLGDDR